MKTHQKTALIAQARDLYEDNDTCDIEIDDNAKFSEVPGGGCWVSAWVWVPADCGSEE